MAAAAVAALLPGCYVRQNYYVSPFNGNSPGYHAIPQVTDSARSAIYTGATWFGGSANDDGNDYFRGFRLDAYRSHHGKILQGYYGLDITLGSYFSGKWDTAWRYSPANAAIVNAASGRHTFGGLGFNGGLNLVTQLPRGEWRYLGVETSIHREWGNYLSFRQHMPDSAATLIIRDRVYATAGLSTEIIGKTRHGDFGFRVAMGWSLGTDYQHPGIHDNAIAGPLTYRYYNFNFHYTYERYTAFFQLNEATKAAGGQIGVAFRLGKPRLTDFEVRSRHRNPWDPLPY